MIRKANKKDIQRIIELLHQVNMVHHVIRPDLFKPNTTKYDEHELEAFRLNTLSQVDYIVEILTDLGVCAALRVLTLRVNKQSHTQGIPAHSLALEEL